MLKVYVKKEISCPVSTTEIKKTLSLFLEKQDIISNADVSVAIVGKPKMVYLAQKYLNEKNSVHNVLSFPYSEGGDFIYPPGGIMHLGDIIVCYPKVLEEVKIEGVLIKEKVMELVCHGALHLMGKHHD
jgi:probable rRNA maturation factor